MNRPLTKKKDLVLDFCATYVYVADAYNKAEEHLDTA